MLQDFIVDIMRLDETLTQRERTPSDSPEAKRSAEEVARKVLAWIDRVHTELEENRAWFVRIDLDCGHGSTLQTVESAVQHVLIELVRSHETLLLPEYGEPFKEVLNLAEDTDLLTPGSIIFLSTVVKLVEAGMLPDDPELFETIKRKMEEPSLELAVSELRWIMSLVERTQVAADERKKERLAKDAVMQEVKAPPELSIAEKMVNLIKRFCLAVQKLEDELSFCAHSMEDIHALVFEKSTSRDYENVLQAFLIMQSLQEASIEAEGFCWEHWGQAGVVELKAIVKDVTKDAICGALYEPASSGLDRALSTLHNYAMKLQQADLTLPHKHVDPPDPTEEWSKPMSKKDIMVKLGMGSRGYRKLKTYTKDHPIRQIGDNRQLWEIRIDGMPGYLRKKFT